MAVSLEEAVEHMQRRIGSGARRLGIQAPPGHGKAAVLEELAASLTNGRPVVRVELPEGDDAALVALVETAIQLQFVEPEILGRVVSSNEPARVPWATKLAAVRDAIARAGEELIVLVHEPRFDVLSTPGTELFGARAVEITQTLLDTRGSVVLAGSFIPLHLAEDAGLRLPLSRDPREPGVDVANRARGANPPHRALSPVVMQVLEVLRQAGVDVDRIPARDLRLDRLVRHDLGRVLLLRAEMRSVVARLAAFRVPISSDVEVEAGLAALSDADRAVVAGLLRAADHGTRAMPAALAQAIRAQISRGDPAWTPEEPAGEAHRFAARAHRARFEAARGRGDVAAAVREELEEIHHLTVAGDATALLTRSLQFVEQYDALGKSLSQKALQPPREREERLRREAVLAYERAIEHDQGDAYAHHYIAYNLDILGIQRERVASEYQTAKDLLSKHAWYHGRHVCFLITTARMNEARAAWERALRELGDTAGALRASDYDELHLQAARLLLSRSELRFAAEVLEDVPERLRGAPWTALEQLRVCLEEDRDERLVFPPTLPLAMRWKQPHLVPVGPSDPEVASWKPGRVLGGDEEVVLVHVGEAGGELSTATFDTGTLESIWKVSAAQLIAGTFVELIEYVDGTREMKLWDRQSSSFDNVPNLPRLFPPPDRYIRRAFAASRE